VLNINILQIIFNTQCTMSNDQYSKLKTQFQVSNIKI